jgi:hypothetical protein
MIELLTMRILEAMGNKVPFILHPEPVSISS